MASTSETGHAKNIANFKLLNERNAGFGAKYNPSNKLLTLANMQKQHTDCNALQGDVNTQKGIYEPAQNARTDEFADVQKLARRMRTAAKTCGASKGFYIDVNKIVTKLVGERAGKPKVTAEDPSGNSVSQQSYDNIVNNFDALAKMLAGEAKYAPNEADLTVAAATAKQAALDATNNAVKSSAVPYNNAVIARNKALYTEDTGLCDVALNSKDYVKQAFTYSSPEFKSISSIAFRKLPKGK